MAKRGQPRRGGRVTPKGTQPKSPNRVSRGPSGQHYGEEPDLLLDVRRALRSGEPLDLLEQVSTLMTVADPRRRNPFDRPRKPNAELPSLHQLVGSFIEVEREETSAILAVIAELTPDDLQRATIKRELARRGAELPPWLTRLHEVECDQAIEMGNVLRDGDNVMLGVHLPDGHELSAVLYIDHNLGSVVKDGFMTPKPLDELVAFMQGRHPDPDTDWLDLTLADAKVRVTEAIKTSSITYPPFETDTWPACRPLVEWIIRQLPDGGTGYVRPEWSDAEKQGLADRFFASPFGAPLDSADHRDLFLSILWFGTDYGPGDPLRWSPSSVEILLDDWIPRKIVADATFLSNAPVLLAAFVRFCHAERSIPATLTEQTLDTIDRLAPHYQRTIRSPRPQGPAALLAALGDFDDDDDLDDLDEPTDP